MAQRTSDAGGVLARHGVYYPDNHLVYVRTRLVDGPGGFVYCTDVSGDVDPLVTAGIHGTGGCEGLPLILTPTYSFGQQMAREQHVETLGTVLKYVMAYEDDVLKDVQGGDDDDV